MDVVFVGGHDVFVVAVPAGDGEQTEADDSAKRRPEDLR